LPAPKRCACIEEGLCSALLETARVKAATEGIDLAACVTQTVQRYAATASDEEWVTLMGLLNRSPDPGATCLQRAFAYAQP
jgi:hypothetical protein